MKVKHNSQCIFWDNIDGEIDEPPAADNIINPDDVANWR
jgi:hypothetical protein